MTIEETRHLDDRFDELSKMIGSLSSEIQTVKRGVYGDEPNGVLGLIQTDKEQHKRIKSLEGTRAKALWTFGGLIAAFEIFWQLIKPKLGL